MIKHTSHLKLKWSRAGVISAVLFVASLLYLFYQIGDQRTLWWDEGWTLSAARNWVEQGHLGHYLAGQPIPVRIPVRFPVVMPVALSMKLFGVGVWQGRLPGAIFTVLTLAMVYYLVIKLYDRRTAFLSLLILLVFSPYPIHPLVIGSQVLAEMPMLFYLFSGYTFLWLAISRSPAWGIGSAIMFGIAIHAKLQVTPFWAASIAAAIFLAYFQQRKKITAILMSVAVGSVVSAAVVLLIQKRIMPDSLNDPALTKILFNSIVMVFSWPVRWEALITTLTDAFPQVVGMIWSGYRVLHPLFAKRTDQSDLQSQINSNQDILRISIWLLGASWFGWYLTMAIYWPRYLFPPYFILTIFAAAYLSDTTKGLNLRSIILQVSSFLLRLKINRTNLKATILLLTCSSLMAFFISLLVFSFTIGPHYPLQTADYLRTNIPKGALVETFESELFFVAPEINFHFPSDLVSMQLVRKLRVDPQTMIDYDPLAADPDYLILGGYAVIWKLYDPIIAQGEFEFETESGGYLIYRRQTSP